MAPGPLAAALQGHDMFLYFGHGSGDQYLSARYRAADRAIYYYQSHPLHSYLLFREQCYAKGAAQLLCVLQWKLATLFALVLLMMSPRSWIACQARNVHLQSHVFGVTSIVAT